MGPVTQRGRAVRISGTVDLLFVLWAGGTLTPPVEYGMPFGLARRGRPPIPHYCRKPRPQRALVVAILIPLCYIGHVPDMLRMLPPTESLVTTGSRQPVPMPYRPHLPGPPQRRRGFA
jgi:hypothetical protein